MNTRKDIGQPLVSDSASGAQPQHSMDAMKKFEWMLSAPPTSNHTPSHPHHDQDYGDLTALNRDGLILKTIGRKNLENIASDYLELLGTASAIYEKNGDYAFGIFSSGWCKMMDSASRSLCQTADNVEALASGRWLCHESCWTNCSKKAIADGVPVDIACHGGIRMYSVPILAHGDVVGAINFGYGDPPTDPEALQTLADRFHLECEDLARMANIYNSRPPFIVELAKKRLHATAQLIGSLIETKQAEKALYESEQRFHKMFELIPDMISIHFPDMNILYSNWKGFGAVPESGRQLGTKCHMTYRGLSEICPDCLAKTVIETGQPIQKETRLPDGRWFDIRMLPLLDENNHVEMFMEWVSDITDRKDAEITLYESKETLRATLNSIGDAVISTDINGCVVSMNPVAESLTGWRLSEAIGKPLDKAVRIVNEHSRKPCKNPVDNVLKGGNIVGLANHTVLISRDGRERPIADSAAPIRNNAGDITGVVLVFRDQSEEHAAQKALIEQKEMLTAIFRNAPLMIMLVDSKRRIRQLNRVAMQFAGRIEKEMVDLRAGEALRCIHALDAPRGCGFGDTCQHCVIRNTVLDTLETGNTYLQIEAPYCSKKPGEEAKKILFFMSSAPVEIKGEQMALVTLQDITEQKKAQSAMQESATRFKRLLANLPMLAVQGYQPDGTAIYWNKGSENLYGYEEEEALGRNLLDLIIPEDMRDLVKQNIKQMVENVTPAPPEELNLMRKDGTLVPVLSCHMILKHEDQRPELFCFDLDLSEIKNSEKERLDLEKHLAQAQKMESVGRLAGGVAHDFNNMLMGIMGYADLCREELDKEHPLQEWLNEITKEAKRSANLTRQLLAFASKQTIKPKTLNLNESIENMLKMLRRLIGEDINLSWHPGNQLWTVKIDSGQVDQILANLCVNARDAIGGNAGEVSIGTENTTIDDAYCSKHNDASPGDYVMLRICDNGRGMNSEILQNIFEPFFTTKGVSEGTGLGLATVYGIVKQNKGFLHVDSEPGIGTTFRIYLPSIITKTETEENAPFQLNQHRGSETILLVEDDKSVRLTVKLFLKKLGYTVIEAESPMTALELAKNHQNKIDLLVTDVVMPVMSGLELAEKLATHHRDVKVLYMSGYTADIISDRGILDTDVNFINKPFTNEMLSVKVSEMLSSDKDNEKKTEPS